MKCDECGKDVPATVGWGPPLPMVGPKQLCPDCLEKACSRVAEGLDRAGKVLGT